MTTGAQALRQRLHDPGTRSVRLAILEGSDEGSDAYTRVNCGGIGRERRFRKQSMIPNSGRGLVPPRRLFRTLEPCAEYTTQCFQLAGCNWRCWYCYVDDSLLRADLARSRLTSISDMVDLFLSLPTPTTVLDLSGGQPDLVPEWALWTMQEIEARGLRGQVHVWVDDNLSEHFMDRYCSPEEIGYMASFPHHSRAGCFKGMDDLSVRTSTQSRSGSVSNQMRAAEKLLAKGFDSYFYLTTLGPFESGPRRAAHRFMNQLKSVHPQLPLRVLPLEIRNFRALDTRVGRTREDERSRQMEGLVAWEDELAESFTQEQMSSPLESIRLT